MTRGDERRLRLLAILRESGQQPVPGGRLAAELHTSRQAVVQDIAVLRSGGESILATSRGYMLASSLAPDWHRAEVLVQHGPDSTAEELNALVDLGVRVVDVAVEHRIYGELRAGLQLTSRADVVEFLDKIGSGRAHLLSELTDGQHLHTIEAKTPEMLERARDELRRLGFLVTME